MEQISLCPTLTFCPCCRVNMMPSDQQAQPENRQDPIPKVPRCAVLQMSHLAVCLHLNEQQLDFSCSRQSLSPGNGRKSRTAIREHERRREFQMFTWTDACGWRTRSNRGTTSTPARLMYVQEYLITSMKEEEAAGIWSSGNESASRNTGKMVPIPPVIHRRRRSPQQRINISAEFASKCFDEKPLEAPAGSSF